MDTKGRKKELIALRGDATLNRMKKSRSQEWSSAPARRVLAALLRAGWAIKRERGSHRVLMKEGWEDYVFAYHDRVEIGPTALKVIGKRTGLTPDDL